MANDSEYVPQYVNGQRVGPPACCWPEVNITAYGWGHDLCNRPSTLIGGTLLLCDVHIKAIAKMSGYMRPEKAEEIVRDRRKSQTKRLQQEIARLRQQITSLQNPPPRKKRPAHGVIYFLRVGGLVKIGWTSNLEQRMRQYQPDSRLLATMPGTLKDEKALHRRYAHLMTHGREWFPLAPQIEEAVAQVVADHGPPPVVDFSARSRSRAVGPKLKATNRADQHHGAWGQATG